MLTSAVAKIAPTKTSAAVTIWTGRSVMADRRGPASAVRTFGSVPRWRTNAPMPSARNRVEASTPASGNSETLSPTESEAPAI